MEEIKVHILNKPGRKFIYMRFRDPMTGKDVTKSTGTSKNREAERIAAKWEHDLREGRYKAQSKITWEEFRERYETEVLPGRADRTASKVYTTFNAVEKHINPVRLAELTTERVSGFQAKLREAGLAESTIKSTLAHLQAALNWAKDISLLHDVPKFNMPKRAKSSKMMKGRPITLEEFERLLAKVPEVVGERAAESWRYLLRGLWWSGLRVGEAMQLWWDRSDKLEVDLSGKFPMLRIPAELEKGHKDRRLPIAPEFAEFLLATPPAARNGPVFNPLPRRADAKRITSHRVMVVVSRIGKAANVKVHTEVEGGKVKFASAHDLRRSFGERWAMRIMPQALQELMRHESMETTMKFYVGRNADRTAEALYAAISGDTLGDSAAESSSANEETPSQSIDATGLSR